MASSPSIVISGISCRFPQSDNMEEFKNNLFNGVDMVTTDKQRFDTEFYQIPRFGQLSMDVSKFDAACFGIPPSQANKMDPGLRMLLEVTFEAIVDAGVDPTAIKGSRTGVYVGAAGSEAHTAWSSNIEEITGYEMVGCEQTMLANKLSHYFDLKGPSYAINSACSSTLLALHQAFHDMRSGRCDNAIVGGTKHILNPSICKQFEKLGMLSPQGRCAACDEDANGYCRSEGIAAVFLQKREDAKRTYCTIVYTMTNNNGHTPQGITFPSKEAQVQLLKDVYREANVDPNDVSYVEVHGTGTQAGDKIETSALCEVMCSNRKEPLLIGSVKTNMGHCEQVAGLASIAKVVIAMENSEIPKNIHYTKPNPDIPGLRNGQLKVVSENTRWNGEFVGLNGFGFGGSNVHVILHNESNHETNENRRRTVALKNTIKLFRGRTYKMVEALLDASENQKACHDFQRIAAGNAKNYHFKFKGYSFGKGLQRKIKEVTTGDRPIWFVFSGMGSQWQGMGQQMMEISLFRCLIMKSNTMLSSRGVNLTDMMKPDGDCVKSVTNAFVGIVAIQIALVDVLKAMGVIPGGMLGHSVGELACAYADGCLTREQTLAAAVIRGECLENAQLPIGSMVATGLTWEDAKVMCPDGVYRACHNSHDSVTVTGRKTAVRSFLDLLKAKKIFAKEVDSDGVAFHSPLLKCVETDFLKSLQKLIPKPLKRTEAWISTSVPKEESDLEHAKFCSPEYLVNNLLYPVLFYDALKQVPPNAIIIEIAPHGILQTILKRSRISNQTIFGLMRRQDCDSIGHFLQVLGELWMAGGNIDVEPLYRKVSWPVAKGTPMLSSLMSWDHTESWAVPATEDFLRSGFDKSFQYNIDTSDIGEYGYLRQHIIDGRAVFPATGYLVLAWRAFATSLKKASEKTPVTFKNVHIHRATLLSKEEPTVALAIYLHHQTPDKQMFGITDKDGLIATGFISETIDTVLTEKAFRIPAEEELVLNKGDIYSELRLRGYGYGTVFKGIQSMDMTGRLATLEWKKDWITFLDLFLQIPAFAVPERSLKVPTRIGCFMIDPTQFQNKEIFQESKQVAECEIERNSVSMKGIFVDRVEYGSLQRRYEKQSSQLIYRFEPYIQDCIELGGIDINQDGQIKDMVQGLRLEHKMMESNVKDVVAIVSENTTGEIRALVVEQSRSLDTIKECLSNCFYNTTSLFVTNSGDTCKETPTVDWNFEDTDSKEVAPFDMIVLDEVLYKKTNPNEALVKLLGIIKERGFIVVREAIPICPRRSGNLQRGYNSTDEWENVFKLNNLVLIARKPDGDRHIIFVLRKIQEENTGLEKHDIIIANGRQFEWLEKLQKRLLNADKTKRVWLVTDDKYTGITGLVNCLKREIGGEKIRCIVNLDGEKKSPLENLINACLPADLMMNIFLNGTWGSFREKEIKGTIMNKYSFVDIDHPGDMSTLKWTACPLPLSPMDCEIAVSTHYASLNFRDIMLASGRLPLDAVPCGISNTEGKLGMEFSGIDSGGRRVMGLCQAQGLATSICAKPEWTYHIPDHWSLQDAATVPAAYCTAFYALIIRGGIERRESILIHSGTGSLGQAAITIALHYDCKVFVTVGNEEKRTFLLERYPSIRPDHIFNSRTTHFERDIKKITNGKGVDLVLNSLTGDAVEAGIRSLTYGGRFLEVGKHEILSNNSISMAKLLDNTAILGVHLDILQEQGGSHVERLHRLVQEGLDSGVIQPLNSTIFARSDIEKAFRHMTHGKHIGKILIQIRYEDATLLSVPVLTPRITFNPNKSYIITGGLGGLGLEIAEWMVVRGAKHLVLVSKSGVQNGFQKRKIQYLTNKGAIVSISRRNICDLEDMKLLLSEVNGCVGGVFHLAGVLRDKLFEGIGVDDFNISCEPKINAARILDLAFRSCNPPLDYFVVTSSIVASRGTVGQTNYGFANSAMERLCELRKRDGLAGLAIQFGLIAGLGMASNYDWIDVFGGTSPQSIASCLASLDILLSQSEPVVSSFVNAKRKTANKTHESSFSETVFHIMGLDEKTLENDAKLGDLGLDSLLALEVKQVIERKTGKVTTTNAVKEMVVQQVKSLN